MFANNVSQHRAWQSAAVYDWLENVGLAAGAIVLVLGAISLRTPIINEKWSTIVENFPFFMKGLMVTCAISVSTFIAGLALGLALALLRETRSSIIKTPAVLFIEFVRAVPQLMLIFWTFFALPLLFGGSVPALVAALLAMTMVAAAYLAEVMRAGFRSVPREQLEGALSCGLSRWQAMRWVVVPQAFVNMLPAFVTQFVMHFKTTALLYIIGIQDIFWCATVVNNREFASVPIFAFVAVVYFVCCATVSWLGNRWIALLDRGIGTHRV
jgi:His/Glu/Gln/Arg/opine family amino acid ABC transporter permease subunit